MSLLSDNEPRWRDDHQRGDFPDDAGRRIGRWVIIALLGIAGVALRVVGDMPVAGAYCLFVAAWWTLLQWLTKRNWRSVSREPAGNFVGHSPRIRVAYTTQFGVPGLAGCFALSLADIPKTGMGAMPWLVLLVCVLTIGVWVESGRRFVMTDSTIEYRSPWGFSPVVIRWPEVRSIQYGRRSSLDRTTTVRGFHIVSSRGASIFIPVEAGFEGIDRFAEAALARVCPAVLEADPAVREMLRTLTPATPGSCSS